MSVTEVKSKLHQYIDKSDERFLRTIHLLFQQYFEEENAIVAFSIDGTPLTKADMIEAADEALSTVESGHSLTSNEIKSLKNNW